MLVLRPGRVVAPAAQGEAHPGIWDSYSCYKTHGMRLGMGDMGLGKPSQ